MISFNQHLFVEEGMKNPEKILEKLNKGKFIKKFYLVALNGKTERLEVLLSYNFLQKYFREQPYDIVALVKSEDSAFEYLRVLSEISVERFESFYGKRAIESLTSEDMVRFTVKEED